MPMVVNGYARVMGAITAMPHVADSDTTRFLVTVTFVT